ncbi:acyl carrier protein [Roseateles chitosanitabidus]|jgi:acyl carrier protein|uniref:acyl carrier protein n=1 Tax=Roseateles chitosanitabidus TaxID=65048 RepID=UPI00082A4D9A|nr:acyl carrier protein [Roseateles chitosanitabidus]MBO9686866.1 acyl carrier protein [Roseateles chitosanitabidus]
MSNTLEQLRRLACHELGMTDDALKNDVAFSELGLDSLMLVDFMFAVEDHFHVQIDHDTAMKQPTIAGLASIVDGLLAEKDGAAKADTAAAAA